MHSVLSHSSAEVPSISDLPSGRQLLFLVGFMGAGKSTVGAALARRLGWDFEDLDDRIETAEKRKVAEIFQQSGEARFRELEHTALQQVLEAAPEAPRVVALGGGAYVQPLNLELLERHRAEVIFLDAPAVELYGRCRIQSHSQRPLLGELHAFQMTYEKRRPGYLKAQWRIETGGKTVAAIVEEIDQELGLSREVRNRR